MKLYVPLWVAKWLKGTVTVVKERLSPSQSRVSPASLVTSIELCSVWNSVSCGGCCGLGISK